MLHHRLRLSGGARTIDLFTYDRVYAQDAVDDSWECDLSTRRIVRKLFGGLREPLVAMHGDIFKDATQEAGPYRADLASQVDASPLGSEHTCERHHARAGGLESMGRACVLFGTDLQPRCQICEVLEALEGPTTLETIGELRQTVSKLQQRLRSEMNQNRGRLQHV